MISSQYGNEVKEQCLINMPKFIVVKEVTADDMAHVLRIENNELEGRILTIQTEIEEND